MTQVGRPPSEVKNAKWPYRMPPSAQPLAEAQAIATKRAFGSRFNEAINTAIGQLRHTYLLLGIEALTKSERGMLEERAEALRSDLESLLKDERNPEREQENLAILARLIEP